MNVLGILFDSTLSWSSHISQTITKSKKLHAIKLIRKFHHMVVGYDVTIFGVKTTGAVA